MKKFNNLNRPIQPNYTLDLLTSGYNTMEQGHKEAIKAASDLETAMATLDLNENEDEWRQNKINEIKQTIDDNVTYGNAYTAMDKLISKAGDLSSDAGMLGRLRAQKDFKTFKEQLNKRTDIPEDYKEYFTEANKYKYEDKKDKKGNIIGGSKWSPTETPVTTVPLNKVLDQGLAWAAKEAGGSTTYRWLDINGVPTSDPSKSVSGEYLNKATSKWEKVTKEKLQSGVQAAIETIPGAKESFNQDYKIAKWKYDNNGNQNPDITNKDGRLLTQSEYTQKRIDPFYDAAKYHNYFSSQEYGNAIKAQLAIGAGATQTLPEGTLVTTTNPVQLDNFMPTRAQAESINSKQNIVNTLKSIDPNGNFDISNKTTDEINKLIDSTVIDPIAKRDLQRDLETINRNEEYLRANEVGKSKDDVDGYRTYNAVMAMGELPKDNPYSKKLIDYTNNIFNGSKAIRNYLSNDGYDKFISSIGGENKAKELGILIGSKNGKKYVELPAEMDKALFSFATAIKNSGSLDFIGGDFYRVDEDGKEVSAMESSPSPTKNVIGGILNATGINRLIGKGIKKSFDGYIDTVDKLKSKNDVVLNGGKITLGQQSIGQATPGLAEAAFQALADGGKGIDNSFTFKIRKEEVQSCLNSIDLVSTGAVILGDNNTMSDMTSEDRRNYTAFLRSAKDEDVQVTSMQDPKTGRWGPLFVIKGQNKDGENKVKPVVFFAPDGFGNKMYESWNKDTAFRAKSDVNIYHATSRPLYLTNASAFANIDKFKLQPDGDGFLLIDDTNKKNLTKINRESAVKYMDLYNQWDDVYNYIKNGAENIDQNSVISLASKVAKMFASFDSNSNKYTIDYYTERLLNNIKN